MELQAAKAQGPLLRALLPLVHEFVIVDASVPGSLSIHLYERIGDTPRCRVRSIQWSELDELHDFADHRWVDTRASESARWLPLPLETDEASTLPAWMLDALRNELGQQGYIKNDGNSVTNER